MGTTPKQDRNFLDEVLGSGLLENAVEWIGQHLEPEQVFDEAKLRASVQGNSTPGDVFTEKELAEWAEQNGYVQPE
jgi:hypothetical protein